MLLCRHGNSAASRSNRAREWNMSWTTPLIVEVCIGMEVTSYASAKV
ncbi:pyrroloquinoline quinone precursor peptide PqqA [Methylocapsa sp. S129]